MDGCAKELIKYYRVEVKAAYTVKSLLKLTYVLGLSNRFFTIHTVWSDSHAHCIVYMQIAINARFNSMHPLSGYSTLSNLFGLRTHACTMTYYTIHVYTVCPVRKARPPLENQRLI